jgi:hypothetical protein
MAVRPETWACRRCDICLLSHRPLVWAVRGWGPRVPEAGPIPTEVGTQDSPCGIKGLFLLLPLLHLASGISTLATVQPR